MNPITYPARPAPGGPFDVALEVGTYATAVPNIWFVEPKFNGWRAMLHTPTGKLWNRHGQQLTLGWVLAFRAQSFEHACRVARDLTARNRCEYCVNN